MKGLLYGIINPIYQLTVKLTFFEVCSYVSQSTNILKLKKKSVDLSVTYNQKYPMEKIL